MRELIGGEIEKVNGNLARVETIKRFSLIETELTPEDDELTPTMKLQAQVGEREVPRRDRIDVSGRHLRRRTSGRKA